MNDLNQYGNDEALDLRSVASKIAARKWWLLIGIVVFTVIFATAAYELTPIYRASTVLIPAKTDNRSAMGGSTFSGLGSVASLVGIDLGGGDSLTVEALAVLNSREFTEKFIEERRLMPVLYAGIWDARSEKWKVDAKHRPTPAKAYRYFNKGIRSVTEDKKTGLITLNVDWTDRIVAADWANDLVKRLNLEMRQREMERSDSAVSYLEKAFDSTTTVATREAISRLIEGQVKRRMFATVTPEYAFRVIDRAMAPDPDELHFPPRLLLLAAGPFVGIFMAIFLILGYDALAEDAKKATPPRASSGAPGTN